MYSASVLRKKFIDFFVDKGHVQIESSSVVPYNDPSLLFTNSGMVQFKDIFLGNINPKDPLYSVKRACSIQRCIRAGGKHNDLDDVGKDNYHHTYFEMMGNWSFGDYYKKEAIDYAYEFLVGELKLNKDNMYVSYFDDGVRPDLETKEYWMKYMDESRILPFNKENFWEMAEKGPCGPCTEIHYDRIGGRDATSLVNKDDPTVVEIWNLVFMQYCREDDGLKNLKNNFVDTGMGMERVLSILNDVHSNYLTDLFLPIFSELKEHSSKDIQEYSDGENEIDMAYRIVADHCRTIAVCLNNDVFPSSTGRGYVLRRIIRRAIRYAKEILKVDSLVKIVEHCSNSLDIELGDKIYAVEEEEKLFLKTLEKGKLYFNKISKEYDRVFPAKYAFVLYDTYGYPFDLTKILCEEKGLTVDEKEFNEHKEIAREKSKKKVGQEEYYINNEVLEKIKALKETDDNFKYEEKILFAQSLLMLEKEEINSKHSILVTDKTSFYSEKGGQVGDKGYIIFLEKDGDYNDITTSLENIDLDKQYGYMEVLDTQELGAHILHIGNIKGKISKNVKMIVDYIRRDKIKKNHTATHILNSILRRKYNSEQCGSLVAEDKLRFDFKGKGANIKEIEEIEKEVNDIIKKNYEVKTEIKNYNETEGIIKLKGEKYPDKVRVVEINNMEELCGGTHVSYTGDIKLLRIINETGIAKNIRRIIAVTGNKAIELTELANNFLQNPLEYNQEEIPVLEKYKIEENLKLIMKNKIKNKKEEINKIVERLKNDENIINYNSNNKKEVVKDLNTISSYFKKLSKEAIIYSKIEEEIFFIAKGKDSIDKITENLENIKMGGKEIVNGKGLLKKNSNLFKH
ncbi:Alanyl-tRNA synthetase [Spraguea lophii 42_110]|uniref:Alanine--tRNA ligase n=1 Tax=Spraguea lophii (strain 42_110) TaxID=1358809 RepID=S7XVZ2_SPRLO|nr:Alanyl-tRNA synthetase [Spraguea lophii 42_110]